MLLEQFKQAGNAILLGTSSFWEGVDVRGEALSCVIIDKLPFASPGDPVLKARLNAMEQQGMSIEVPTRRKGRRRRKSDIRREQASIIARTLNNKQD